MYKQDLDFALTLADAADKITLPRFEANDLVIESKPDMTQVSDADLECEKVGGPIMLTHAEVTRYFMTIPEAAQLVLQAGAMAQGGDVFVLDMGQPVRIIDLARDMVVLSGLTVRDAEHPHGDIALHITGLRPGEKLYEELLIGDNPQATEHPRIMKAQEAFLPWPQLQQQLLALHACMERNDVAGLVRLLLQLVSGFHAGPVVDNIALQQQRLGRAHG